MRKSRAPWTVLGERGTSGTGMTLSTLVVTLAQLARLKVFALSIGVAGVGIIAQVSAAQNLLLGLTPLFSGIGLITVLARRRLDGPVARERCLASARGLAIVAVGPAALAGSVIVLLAGRLDPALATVIIVGLLGVPLAFLTSVELADLQERGYLGRLAAVNVITALATLLLITLLSLRLGVTGAAIGLGLSLAVGWLVAIAASRGPNGSRFSFDRSEWGSIAHAGSGLIAATLVAVASEAGIRALALTMLGSRGAGLTHILLTLALQLSYLLGAGITAYSVPRIAAFIAANDRPALLGELRMLQKLGTLAAGGALLILAAAREPFVAAFLSEEFQTVADLLPLMLFGELLRMQSWTVGQYLLPRGHRRVYVAVTPVFYLTFAAGFIVLAPAWGIAAVPIAHIAASAAGAAVILWHARRALGYPIAAALPTVALVAFGLAASLWVPLGGIPFAALSLALAYRTLRQEALVNSRRA